MGIREANLPRPRPCHDQADRLDLIGLPGEDRAEDGAIREAEVDDRHTRELPRGEADHPPDVPDGLTHDGGLLDRLP